MGQRLGQHFLKNTEVLGDIIGALEVKPGETIIEIGPGAGALTMPLAAACAQKGAKLVAIERDEALAESLKQQAGDSVEIISADALDILPEIVVKRLTSVNFRIVGNIPYYITGSLLRLIGELEHKPVKTVLMVQKEVAERVSASPPEMNLLAAATQIWSDISIIAYLKPEDFDPPPSVASAVIALTTKERQLAQKELEAYYRLIKAAFKQPRKTLRNNLGGELLEKAGISPDLRGQNLTIDELIRLSML